MQTTSIRPAAPQDAQAVCRIYNHHVAHSMATFEEELLTLDAMAARISETYKEVGFKFEHWIDVGYWQTLL
ncbi:MAG: hypothetical protein WCB49_03600 [Gammaproteobacteria bacterium]